MGSKNKNKNKPKQTNEPNVQDKMKQQADKMFVANAGAISGATTAVAAENAATVATEKTATVAAAPGVESPARKVIVSCDCPTPLTKNPFETEAKTDDEARAAFYEINEISGTSHPINFNWDSDDDGGLF